jgi:hypothetical protein
MFDEAVCYVENTRFLVREINNLRRQAFFAFRLDGGCAIGEGFLDARTHARIVAPALKQTSLVLHSAGSFANWMPFSLRH